MVRRRLLGGITPDPIDATISVKFSSDCGQKGRGRPQGSEITEASSIDRTRLGDRAGRKGDKERQRETLQAVDLALLSLLSLLSLLKGELANLQRAERGDFVCEKVFAICLSEGRQGRQ